MKKLLWGALLALAVLAGGVVSANRFAPKAISDIMEEAHEGGKDSLRARVVAGKGTAEDAKKLLALYEDLGKNDPPKGEKAAWKKKTDAIVVAAKKVAEKPEDPKFKAALDQATICNNCHKDHKP